MRREYSVLEALSLPIQAIFIGTVLAALAPILIAFVIAVELKAMFARHRIRKEQALKGPYPNGRGN